MTDLQRERETNKSGLKLVFTSHGLIERCCYITMDSAMAASQNGFCSYKLSIYKKTNIMQIMTKKLQFLFVQSFIIEKLGN
jgi:hypothetical protein